MPEQGIYLLTVYQEDTSEAFTVPFVSPYPQEYREVTVNSALLRGLARETGGEVMEPRALEEGLRRFLSPRRERARPAQETWWALTSLGLMAFLSDLGLRRFRPA